MTPGPVLDQGASSQCVAFATVGYLTAHPVVNKAIDTSELYTACQRVDEWDGEDYDGTSVRAAFKVLLDRGYVSAYQWAWDAATVAAHILATGPVVVGTNWHRDMFTPTAAGYVTPTGPVDGGHAYLLVAVNLKRQNPDGTVGAFRLRNSWGPGWGASGDGRAWISVEDMDQLIHADGDACAAVEQKLV
jgi:C1A family cysteine protease